MYKVKRGPAGNRKIKNATKLEYEGIIWDSKLELYMGKLLLGSKIIFSRQHTFELMPGFRYNGAAIRPIKIVVDFYIPSMGFIIDTKGYQLADNKLKVKLLKHLLYTNGTPYQIFMPSTQKECDALYWELLRKKNMIHFGNP